jgi:arylsulfatase
MPLKLKNGIDSLIFVIILSCIFHQGCAENRNAENIKKEQPNYFSFIEKISNAEITADDINLFPPQKIALPSEQANWKSHAGMSLLSLSQEEGSLPNLENGIIEIQSTFLNPHKEETENSSDLPSEVNKLRNNIITAQNQWMPMVGNWNFEGPILLNQPLKNKILFDPNHSFGKNTTLTPKFFNWIRFNNSPSQDFIAKVDIAFSPESNIVSNLHNGELINKKVQGMGGIYFRHGEPIEGKKKQKNGFIVFTDRDSNLLYSTTDGNKLISPKLFMNTLSKSRLEKEHIGVGLTIKRINDTLDIWAGNYLHQKVKIENLSQGFGFIGIANAFSEKNKFLNFGFQPIYDNKKQANDSEAIAGLYFGKNKSFGGYYLRLNSKGFLQFGELDGPVLRTNLISKENIKPSNKLKVVFWKNKFLVFLNDQLVMNIQPAPSKQPISLYTINSKKIGAKENIYANKINLPAGNISLQETLAKGSWGLVSSINKTNFQKIKVSAAATKNYSDINDFTSLQNLKKVIFNFKTPAENQKLNHLVSNVILDQATRKSLVFYNPSQITYKNIKIPRNAYLSFGVAAIKDSILKNAPGKFSIIVRSDQKENEVYSVDLNKPLFETWGDNRVNLEPFSGKDVDIIIKYTGSKNVFLILGDIQILSQANSDDYNVILISIDTLRSDHLSSYGYPLKTSPNMDRIAREGVLFKNSIVQAPWTYPSHSSMLTSMYPSALGYKFPGNDDFSTEIPSAATTLAEILKYNGYLTFSFNGGANVASRRGFSKGFSYYNEKWVSDIEVVYQNVTDWISSHQKDKFFLFFHTYEVHEFKKTDHEIFSHTTLNNPDVLKRDIALYDSRIKLVDNYLGLLDQFLKSHKLKRKTLIIITSDHGIAFYEHGLFGHGFYLYDELLKVPLIFSLPSALPKNMIVNKQVQIVDIMPTILDLLKIPNRVPLAGKSLRPFFEGKEEERTAFSEATYFDPHVKAQNPTSIRTNQHKYIEYEGSDLNKNNTSSENGTKSKRMPTTDFFDLTKNPQEKEDQQLNDQTKLTEFSNQIKNFKRENSKKFHSFKKLEKNTNKGLQSDVRKRLQALGYLN